MKTAKPPIPPFGHHPVIKLPAEYQVRDFTKGLDPALLPFSVGKYNENRKNMYTHELFNDLTGIRTIHMGIDIGAPVNTPIYAFKEGVIDDFTYHASAGDYGYTLITKHQFQDQNLWCLYGHLNQKSIHGKMKGAEIQKGEVIAFVGDVHENGGWPPHLHFQISFKKPLSCDMPGVVHLSERRQALSLYPDPQMILGSLYLD